MDGRVPKIKLNPNSSDRNEEILKIELGNFPFRLFAPKSSTFKFLRFPISFGMLPWSLLNSKPRYNNLELLTKGGGMVLVKLFCPMYSMK